MVVIKIKASAWPYSLWIRVLERGGIGGLVVRVLAQNARGVDLNPTWSHNFSSKWMFHREKFLYKMTKRVMLHFNFDYPD